MIPHLVFENQYWVAKKEAEDTCSIISFIVMNKPYITNLNSKW